MGRYRTEALVLLAAGALLTVLSVADLLSGNAGQSVVTAIGAILSFVLAVLVTASDRRQPPRPGEGDERD